MSIAPPPVCPRRHDTADSGPLASVAVLKSSRARPNKTQRGWGNLASHPLQLILSHVLDNTSLESSSYLAPLGQSVALAFARRNWLADMRLVSSGWSKVVDSHPFWSELVSTMRPELANPPEGVQFAVARAVTNEICLPCRLTHPTRPSQQGHYRQPTAKLGLIPACHVHYGQICSHCLRVQVAVVPGETGLLLRRPVFGDVDELGNPRHHDGVVCLSCREAAFIATVRRDLETCSRGRSILGLDNNWSHTVAYKEHVYFGVGRSDMMARQAVEDWFLMQHTRYSQLLNEITPVQATLRRYKVHIYENNRAISPPQTELHNIARVIWNVFEDDESGFDLNYLYRRWCREMDTKAYDDADYRMDIERIRLNLGGVSLWPWVRDKVAQRAIELWIQDRFLNGYWVMPSDEIEQMLNPGQDIHTPFLEVAQEAVRPSDYSRYSGVDVWRSGAGRFRYNSVREQRGAELFLPPDRLLQMMNIRFSEVASLRMDAALAEVIRPYARLPYKDFDRVEAYLAAFKVPQLITLLQEPFAWFEVDDPNGKWPVTVFPLPPASETSERSATSEEEGSEEQGFAEFEADLGAHNGSNDGADDEDGENDRDSESVKPSEPLIEVVSSTNGPQDYFEVVDGWSTASDEPDEFDVADDREDHASDRSGVESPTHSGAPSPKLGKRKATDDEEGVDDEARGPRSRLGSGQTSHSGDSTNTALVTPDESPSLLAEERIRVAEDDDAAVDTTPVAALAMGHVSPTASPTLGKRKSPDDDDLIRPPRRPASIPTPTREEGSETSDDDMGFEEVATGHEQSKIERGTTPSDKTDDDEAKAHVASDEDMSVGKAMADAAIDDDDMGEDDSKRSAASDNLFSAPSEAEDDEARTPKSPSPVQQRHSDSNEVARVAAVRQGWIRAESEYSELSDSVSEASIDSEKLGEVPAVPPPWAKFGPGFTELLDSSWYRMREKLRLCRCSVCVRAKKAETEAERRKYLEDEDEIVIPGALRIA